jgi:2-haloacid dehalogenase
LSVSATPRSAVCVFAAYGTLFDLGSATARHLERLGADAAPLGELWRRKQLEYTWLRSLMAGAWVPFERVVADALDHAMAAFGREEDRVLRDDLLAAYRSLDTYPEVPGVLSSLRRAGIPLAILSNGSRDMLSAAVDGAGLTAHLDGVLSVDEVGVFKPHPDVYRLALAHFGLGSAAAQVCFVSANAWDAAGAARFGFRVFWCNRAGAPAERLGAPPLDEITTLAGLPERLMDAGV